MFSDFAECAGRPLTLSDHVSASATSIRCVLPAVGTGARWRVCLNCGDAATCLLSPVTPSTDRPLAALALGGSRPRVPRTAGQALRPLTGVALRQAPVLLGSVPLCVATCPPRVAVTAARPSAVPSAPGCRARRSLCRPCVAWPFLGKPPTSDPQTLERSAVSPVPPAGPEEHRVPAGGRAEAGRGGRARVPRLRRLRAGRGALAVGGAGRLHGTGLCAPAFPLSVDAFPCG